MATTNDQLKGLQDENDGLKKAYADLEKQNDVLKKQALANADDIRLAKEQASNLQEKVTQQENELTAVYQVNETYKAEIEALTNPQAKEENKLAFQKESFELDGDKYGFQYGATILNGQKYTSTQIAADENLQKELVKLNAGILKKI